MASHADTSGASGPAQPRQEDRRRRLDEAALPDSQRAVVDALDRLPLGVFLVDTGGKVRFMNKTASDLLGGDGGLALRRECLVATDGAQTEALRDLVRRTTGEAGQEGGESYAALSVRRAGTDKPLSVIAVPLRGGGVEMNGRRSMAVLFVSDPERDDEQSKNVLINLYGLTRAEADLALALLGGSGLERAAKQLGISINTARTHLKHVFEKTNTNRQAELVRLILRGPAALRLD